MIKGIGIRIIVGVNEMLPAWYYVYGVDEGNADDRASSRAIYRRQRETAQKADRRLPTDKHTIVFHKIMHFHLR